MQQKLRKLFYLSEYDFRPLKWKGLFLRSYFNNHACEISWKWFDVSKIILLLNCYLYIISICTSWKLLMTLGKFIVIST